MSPQGTVDWKALTDQEVVRHAVAGREAAYRELIRRYQRPVFSLLYRMVRDRELAEDLAQETFLKAWKALARFDPGRRFSSWIFKIAHNSALDELRRRRRQLPAPAARRPKGNPDAQP